LEAEKLSLLFLYLFFTCSILEYPYSSHPAIFPCLPSLSNGLTIVASSTNHTPMQKNQNKHRNQLWLARKRLGLGQKHVARLLNHKTTDQVSRYEKGWRIPGLQMLLQLEIIYGVPARVLYREWYEELRAEIENKASTLKPLSNAYTLPTNDASLFSEFCFHEELLRNPHLSQAERDKVRKPVVLLMKRLNQLD
jgi:transcriptional regulator with XRE-family HTH domain